MNRWLLVFPFVIVYRFCHYWERVFYIDRLRKQYIAFMETMIKFRKSKTESKKPEGDAVLEARKPLSEARYRFETLVQESGYDDSVMRHEQVGPTIYKITTPTRWLLDDEKTEGQYFMFKLFDHIRGFNKTKAWESFSPLYWINAILHLPGALVDWLIKRVKAAFT